MRERRACFGELVQIDGSDHDWFEGVGRSVPCWCLLTMPPRQLLELLFVPHESFFGYCAAAKHYFERYGKPVAFYSDKHGIFRVNQEQNGRFGQRFNPIWTRYAGTGHPNYLC